MLAFSQDGKWLYVTNLTLNLPFVGTQAAIDSAWTLQVQGYTVSVLPSKIPGKGAATPPRASHLGSVVLSLFHTLYIRYTISLL